MLFTHRGGMGIPAIVNDHTFALIRYVLEVLGVEIHWDEKNGAVYVY
ncbi:MAG: copper amine oxidase N-terminal domain-containing protein [Defluviitaleaceae bacterium]|nr:copper amine oxidase N-terminal domain-containing protein [Defluviitaleaceae bacterium]